jgi:hypothetical protein
MAELGNTQSRDVPSGRAVSRALQLLRDPKAVWSIFVLAFWIYALVKRVQGRVGHYVDPPWWS